MYASLHHFYKGGGGDISDCLLFALATCDSWLLGGGGGEWVRSEGRIFARKGADSSLLEWELPLF